MVEKGETRQVQFGDKVYDVDVLGESLVNRFLEDDTVEIHTEAATKISRAGDDRVAVEPEHSHDSWNEDEFISIDESDNWRIVDVEQASNGTKLILETA